MPIRAARADDVAEVRRCVFDAYAVYLSRLDRPPAPLADDYGAAVRNGGVFLDDEGGLRGVIVLVPHPDHLEVRNLAVRPEFQGQGVGSGLLVFADARARALGRTELRLCTNEAMVENLRFYARRDFREVDRRVEDGYRRVFFVKTVDRPRRARGRARAAPARR